MSRNAAIIGGGNAAELHAAALKACGAEIAAVVTENQKTAEDFADKWGIPEWGTDLELALDDRIDSVHICTPPPFHGSYMKAALDAGKDVICEKPLCFSSDEGHELAELAERSGRVCAVDFNVRYQKAVKRARELVRGGAFGRPLVIHGCYLQEFHILPAPYHWRYDPELAGDMRAVTEIGSHWIDAVQYISGDKITAVSASFADFFPDRIIRDGVMEKADDAGKDDTGHLIHVKSEDAACLVFRFEDGAIGNLTLSEISHGRANRLALEITCENGSLWWNEDDYDVLYTAVKGEGIKAERFECEDGFQYTFASLMRDFFNKKNYPTICEGAQVVDVCNAAKISAAHGSAWTEVRTR
ncbi:MAG: Gfo/Idh/MocA family oxidoreductase [Eubacterium sp.]|nr:Gfo/Idh/MocA family oxidoreductase [Eubacterium sp.]